MKRRAATDTGILIGVIPSGYPNVCLPKKQLLELQESILQKVKSEKISPKFLKWYFKLGWIVLVCADEGTINWLKFELDPKKFTFCAMTMSIVSERNFPNTGKIAATFLDTTEKELSVDILRMLQNQNDLLRTDNWTVTLRKNYPNEVHLNLSIDPPSLFIIQEMRYSLFYKFGKIKIRLRRS